MLSRGAVFRPYTLTLGTASSGAVNSADRVSFRRLQVFRYLASAAVALFLFQTLDLGVGLGWWLGASLFGVFLAGRLASSGKTFWSVLLKHALGYLTFYFIIRLTNYFVTGAASSGAEYDFMIAQFGDHAFLILLAYSANFLATWIFWTKRFFATFEAIVFSASIVWLLGGHRNYHLDAPKQVSSLAWKQDFLQRLHAQPQHIFIACGALFIIGLTMYLALSAHRPIFGQPREIRTVGKANPFLTFGIPIALLIALGYYSYALNERFSADLSKATEGVGQAGKEGQSNLGFHSAVGQTKQPAALVRLEGDYSKNPWAPMLYFREGALSDFNGHELVVSSAAFDQDVPRGAPGQPYVGIVPDKSEGARGKVVQSIYLLTKHNAPFAVDYPTRMNLIKNPDPQRFTLAYQAISNAPVVKFDELKDRAVGEPNWDKATLEHYLRAPGSLAGTPPDDIPLDPNTPVNDEHGEDLRYLGLTRQLSGAEVAPLARTERIIGYLSKESIYTRSPGHQVTQGGDPVAPYLFSEKKRGYCVHFAHAAVYMLRLAGIPARIGTGYLTDLTYAKDGHILLQMGDRHAWPEIYLQGFGWTIVDVNPAQAENEQAPVPDEKLLEELMSKIDPAQELLDPLPEEQTSIDTEQLIEKLVDARVTVATCLVVFLLFLVLKLYLRNAYRFARNDKRRARLAYISFASQMTDLGLGRELGETRVEFSSRLKARLAVNAEPITKVYERLNYSTTAPGALEPLTALQEWKHSFDSQHGRWRRAITFFSPRSVMRLWTW